MGQTVNPISNRLPITKGWQSRWFAERDYGTRLLEDLKMREFLNQRYQRQAALGKVEITRTVGGQIHIVLHTAKPGIIIGRAGSGLADLRRRLEDLLGMKPEKNKSKRSRRPGGQVRTATEETGKLKIDIVEIRTPELWAQLVGDTIASQIERRVAHRRAARQAIERMMSAGAKGVKIVVSGRLGGAEISRTDKFTDGSVPLSTFRAEIDYGRSQAQTTYGTIGIQVWIHRGELGASEVAEES